MKRIIVIIMLAMLLTGCQTSGTIYRDDAVTVFRTGRDTTVTDTLTGTEYHFTTRRVKRPLTAVCKPTTDTDTVQIMLVRNEIIIHEKTTGKTVCIR